MANLRPELETPLPSRMVGLPVHRGYPVPWFVEWVKDETGTNVPEFRATSGHKWVIAVKQRRCWVCGDRLGGNLAFVIGPMCGITRTTSEPPCHLECAAWSARNCPFLARPHMVRRDENLPPGWQQPPGYMLDRNPGVTLVWVTKSYTVFDDGKGQPLIQVGDPVVLLFFAEGRQATIAEIKESVDSGLPHLREKVQAPEEETQLQGMLDVFWRLAYGA